MRKLFKYFSVSCLSLVVAIGFTFLALNAMEQQQEWSEDRLHRYYLDEIIDHHDQEIEVAYERF